MIKIKMKDALNLLGQAEAVKKLPLRGSGAFTMARLVKQLKNEQQTYSESLTKLIDEYGKKDDDGKLVKTEDGFVYLNEETKDEFQTNYSALLEAEIEIAVNPLTDTMFESVELNAELAEFLMPFME